MRRLVTILMIFTATAIIFGSCGDRNPEIKVDEGVAARIGTMKITDEEINEKLGMLPDNQKDNFKGESGKARFVDMIINDELFYIEAKNRNLRNLPEVKAELEAVERRILIGAFYTKEIKEKVEITDEEIQRYYDDNVTEFTNNALYKAQHIFSTDSMKCVEWRRRIVEGGEKLSAIAKAESEDFTTAPSYGDLGYFNPGGYVKFIGRSATFTDDLEGLAVGEVSQVIKHEKGYSIVRLNDHKPATIKPLSEVRVSIIDKLKEAGAKERLNQEIERLREKYEPINLAQQRVMEMTRTPEQLWEIAQAEDAPYTRILYYRELVNRYPDHKFAPQALFMIGFVYTEELQDLTQGRRTFEELLREYPDSEVADSAKWMIENIYEKHPKFESLEGVQRHIEKEKEGQ